MFYNGALIHLQKTMFSSTHFTFALPVWWWQCEYCPSYLEKQEVYTNIIELNDVYDFFLQPNINDPNKISKALVTASLVWFGLLPMPWPGHLGFFHCWCCCCWWWCSVLGMVTMMMIDNDAVGLWLLDEKIRSENLRRSTMTTTSQAVCAPTDVCRKRQEPRSPARSRFPGVEGGGLLLYYFLLVSDFVNDVHVENWKGGTVAPVLKIHFAHLLDVERWLQRPLLSSPGRRAPFAGGWRSIEISKLLTIRSKPQLSLTQITWDNSAGPRPSATVRGTRKMSLGWTGWAGGLWGRSGWFGDDDDDYYYWAGWTSWAYHDHASG